MKLTRLFAGVAIAASLTAVAAHADVTRIATQAAFNAAGVISQNTNWDAYPAGFSFPGDPFTVGDLTFVALSQNIIGDTSIAFNTVRPLLTDNFGQGTIVQIAGQHDLFAFNLGNFAASGQVGISVATNLAAYGFFLDVNTAVNQGALTFAGFQADPGEYITQVEFGGPIFETGATDIQLGAPVPEPAGWVTMLLGFGGLGAVLRGARRRRLGAAAAA